MKSENKNGLLISSAVLVVLVISFYITKLTGINPVENPIAVIIICFIIEAIGLIILAITDKYSVMTNKCERRNKQCFQALFLFPKPFSAKI